MNFCGGHVVCKKVILGGLFGFLFVSFAQGYDLVDLELMAYDWLFERPQIMHWDFDMSTDPVGDGPFDLMVRDGGTPGLYRMDGGKMIFDSDITDEPTVIENKHQYSTYDMEYHYVARSTSDTPFHLWVDIQSAAEDDGELRCFVGNSIQLDGGNQTVTIWDGNPWGNSGDVITGLDPDAFITIDVDIYYETQTLIYTVSQLGSVVASDSINYIVSTAGTSPGGEYAFQCGRNNVGHAEVDHFTATTYGPALNWFADYDIAPVGSPDGKVDLLDFAVLAEGWLN